MVDDEPLARNAWKRILSGADFDVCTFGSAPEALASMTTDPEVDVVVTDLAMPEMTGLQLLGRIKAERPEIEVVIVTAHADLETAVSAVKGGAYHFLAKPFPDLESPCLVIRQAAERKRLICQARALEWVLREREATTSETSLLGSSEGMREVKRLISATAPTSSSVLILGESGTGKELVAKAIHRLSGRRPKPFVAVNCSALTESILESELFGHVRGAFTGAEASRAGLFEAADGGTLLLDEVGEAPPSVQAKLLRVLQEGEVRPVGSTRVVHVDVRVIAATNVDLHAAVRAGRFREDLFYRLNVLQIRLPALRERRQDIGLLACHFLSRHAAMLGRDVRDIAPEALAALEAWSWPGNVRELENAIERAVVLGHAGRVELRDLPDSISGLGARRQPAVTSSTMTYSQAKEAVLDAFERAYVEELLGKTGGNISEAARLAGLDRSNFKRILRRSGG
ncbi:MAG: sigma-54-dependent Fis family transcriptional regulator [Deltaproteobacteria bacterium]|nr:sigma-54-dependent Fis family transcriptional regulator [Deltaproteobacteria bacterium]